MPAAVIDGGHASLCPPYSIHQAASFWPSISRDRCEPRAR